MLLAVVVAIATGGTTIAVAGGGGGPKPRPKALASALHDALSAKAPNGITARIAFTSRLFPSAISGGEHVSALIAGASGRLWARNDGHGRIELQSSSGDVQIIWGAGKLTVYDASSNTVYRVTLPKHRHGAERADSRAKSTPSASRIARFLATLREQASVSAARSTDVAGRPAYSVTIGPKRDGGLLGAAELAWDAVRGVPLRAALYAKGSSNPVLALEVTDISFGRVPLSYIALAPPPSAKTVDLGRPLRTRRHARLHGHAALLRHAARDLGFTVLAPATLGGLVRTSERTVGAHAALVVYGHGLDALVVLERKAGANRAHNGPFAGLPTVALDGVTGHELATQLGTAIAWQRNGIAFVLAGSHPSSDVEAAARGLK